MTAFACALVPSPVPCHAADDSQVEFQHESGRLIVTVSSAPMATYVFQDEKIPRPYFAQVKGPSGIQVTRNHPPIAGHDLMDHDTMHPGIWLAFGDLNGADVWRNKARVVHEAFVGEPKGGAGRGTFAVRNRYEQAPDAVVCRELCRLTILVRPQGYLLLWDSTFTSDREFYFGDQEEMGLGLRVTTPISVQTGGTMLDSHGRRNEREIWGNSADWCDYSGTVNGQHVGMTVFCHPQNFRPCWLHARDYGFVAANPFGRQAFGKGAPSKVMVAPSEAFRLRYGVLIHTQTPSDGPDLKAAYDDYVQLTAEEKN